MRQILLVRHGESEWNATDRWQGWLDVPLTAVGELQARRRGAQLAADGHHFSAVWTSDLARARRTAELIAEALGAPRPRAHRGFRERHGGAFQGLDHDDLEATHPVEYAAWRAGRLDAPPGGETDEAVLTRFDTALAAAHADATPGDLLVVTHGGIARLVARRAGMRITGLLANCEAAWFRLEGDELVSASRPAAFTAADATE